MKKAAGLCIIALLLLSFAVGAHALEAYMVGKPFQDFSVTGTEGETISLSQLTAENKLVVVQFFATWYPDGADDLKLLEKTCAQRQDKIALVALSSYANDDEQAVKNYREKYSLGIPVGCASEELSEQILQIRFPTTLFIDQSGKVCCRFDRCFTSQAELDQVLDTLLSKDYDGTPFSIVSAYVRDQNMNPAPGMTVSFKTGDAVTTVVTDEAGYAYLPQGELHDYTIWVSAAPEGYEFDPEWELSLSVDDSYTVISVTKTEEPEKVEIAALPEPGNISLDGPFTLENIRQYVLGIDQPVKLADGTMRPAISFDNAATTPALIPVMAEVNSKLMMYGSVGRGFAQKSDYTTEIYHATRDKVLKFVNADADKYTCFYVNNTTDGLNKLASALITSKDDIVLTTRIEHHANDLSWRERCKVIYAEVDEQGRVIYDDIEKLLKENQVKYVSVTAASNVTGYVTDVHRVAKLAHQYGAKIIVDGAQIVAHRAFSMKGETEEEDIDFFVFSAHKMYSPYGGGAVVGLTEVLDEHMPTFYGGGTIRIVGDYWQHYKSAPESYEAGSPNYPGVVGMGKAIDILREVGFDAIQAHELELNRRLIDGLKTFDNVIIYGDSENISDRVGVVTFNFSTVNSYLLAKRLATIGGVATRRGAFCANPYVWRLMGVADDELEEFEDCADMNTPGMIRVSFGIYNTDEEVDEFLRVLAKALRAASNDQNFVENSSMEY